MREAGAVTDDSFFTLYTPWKNAILNAKKMPGLYDIFNRISYVLNIRSIVV